ncbi:MAG: HlyD family type I secretion periplasmic adaptor subunit [Thermodesulfobacteriota bacterium]|nr:HlyD family type I secretion periplasmic adaptor subunit [Thermodesulfobacteriota bacterium]
MSEKPAENSAVEPQEKEFETNPRRIILAGLIVIALFFGGLGTWAALSPFSGAVIAPGSVKVTQERKTVQHLEGGMVDEIYVREGSKVKPGQLLIRLKSEAAVASVDMLRGQLTAKLAQQARLLAESSLEESIEWPEELTARSEDPEVAAILKKERDIFTSQRTDLLGKLDLIQSQIRQLEEKIIGAEEEFEANSRIIAALQEEVEAKETLLEGRYIDMSQVLELRRRLAEREGDRGRLRQTIAETRQRIEELKLQRVDLKNRYRTQAATRLSEVSDEIFALREKLRPALDTRVRLEIRAPIAGEVINLQVHSEGAGVIRPGQPIMEIVPEGAELIVESRIKPEDITKVRPGQPAKVQLTAFNRREVSPVDGEVTYVSADQLMDERTNARPYYLVHVRVNPAALEKEQIHLSPGMPAVCFITTDQRTVLGYLLEPLFYFLDRSLREG